MDNYLSLKKVVGFLSTLDWQIIDKLNNFFQITPPKYLNFSKKYSIYIPKDESSEIYSEYIEKLFFVLSSVYKINISELYEIVNKYYNEKWSKEGLLNIMKNKKSKESNLRVYSNQTIEFGEAYIIVTFIDHVEEVKSELIMIMIDNKSKVEMDGLVTNYPAIFFKFIKENKREYCLNNALRIGQFKLEQHYFEKSSQFTNRLNSSQIYEAINLKLISEKTLVRLILTYESVKEYLMRSKSQEMINLIKMIDKFPRIENQPFPENF